MGLETYYKKRDFSRTPEPRGRPRRRKGALRFVVQRHEAAKLHYDFRLEMGGVLKSWAIPKGPSLNPSDKRLAVPTEDHPLSYSSFEGEIPEGNYGAGQVEIWDSGTYHVEGTEDPAESEERLLKGLEEGNISFVLEGEKMQGAFSMIRMKGRQEGSWLLIKKSGKGAVSEPYEIEAHDGGPKPEELHQPKGPGGGKTPRPQKKETEKEKEEKIEAPLLPMMARLADEAFDDPDWIYEIKWDGYRALADVKQGAVELYSRNGKSYGDKYPPILEALQQWEEDVLLDGEIVVLDEGGHASFQQLQNYQNTPSKELYFYVFDLLRLNGKDLKELPLLERKKKLQEIMRNAPEVLRYSDHVEEKGEAFFREAQQNGIEGIMAKKADSPYREGKRSSEWLKIKTHLRQEAVICGFTEPQGKRKYIGALVLGVYEEDKLQYVGQSGSGFDSESLQMLKDKLEPLEQESPPFSGMVNPNVAVHWVKPELVGEFKFAEWTAEGLMRQAIFQGLREDKKAEDVVREQAQQKERVKKEAERKPSAKRQERKGNGKSGKTERIIEGQAVLLSSLDKAYWPEENISKGQLIDYYQSIGNVLLPYLKDRPQTLLRNPAGITKAGFFQKDIPHTPDWVRTEKILAEATGDEVEYLLCDNKASLAYMNNLGCIQLNPWNSRFSQLDKPDYMVIDLDPGENTFDEVVEVALVTKEVLDRTGAKAFCKTSGARGMHIFVPTGAKYSFEQVRQFAHILAQLVHEKLPKLTSLERKPKERSRQVYLDYLQNSIGQTIAAVYSVRPRKGAPVSTPLEWEEVRSGLLPEQFTIENMPDRLKEKGDLFKGVLREGVDLLKCLERLG